MEQHSNNHNNCTNNNNSSSSSEEGYLVRGFPLKSATCNDLQKEMLSGISGISGGGGGNTTVRDTTGSQRDLHRQMLDLGI